MQNPPLVSLVVYQSPDRSQLDGPRKVERRRGLDPSKLLNYFIGSSLVLDLRNIPFDTYYF